MLTNKFKPTVAELREIYTELVSPTISDWSEGWEQVSKAIGHYGMYQEQAAMESFDEVTREVVKHLGFQNICLSENIVADRARFAEIYQAIQKRKRTEVNVGSALPNLWEMVQNRLAELDQKEQKAIDPKRKIFDGEHDPDPSDVFDKWEREKKLNSVVASYPTSESNVEFLKAKREILKKEQEKAKQKKKKAFKRTIAGVLAAATLYAGVKIGQKMEDNSKINKATQTLVDLSEDTLTEYGLGTKENGKFEIGNNSVSDYSVLDANTPMEVYIYKLAINDNEEFNKFIRSVSYSDGVYCYESYEQFLRINGYYDQTSNKISDEVFSNIMRGTLLTAYENSTLSSYENEYYTTNLDSEPKTR